MLRIGLKSLRCRSSAKYLFYHLARQGHIPGGNYVRRVSDRVSDVGSENLGVSLFVGNGHTPSPVLAFLLLLCLFS